MKRIALECRNAVLRERLRQAKSLLLEARIDIPFTTAALNTQHERALDALLSFEADLQTHMAAQIERADQD